MLCHMPHIEVTKIDTMPIACTATRCHGQPPVQRRGTSVPSAAIRRAVREAQRAHDQHRGHQQEHRLREFDAVVEAEHRQAPSARRTQMPTIHTPETCAIQSRRSTLIRTRSRRSCSACAARAARPQDHVIRHAQNPVAGRRPEHRQPDPVPQVREGPHVDRSKKRFRTSPVVPNPSCPRCRVCARCDGSRRRSDAFLPLRRRDFHGRQKKLRQESPMRPIQAAFPAARFRRLRRTRRAARPGAGKHADGEGPDLADVPVRRDRASSDPIASMPGVARLSQDTCCVRPNGRRASASRRSASFPISTRR